MAKTGKNHIGQDIIDELNLMKASLAGDEAAIVQLRADLDKKKSEENIKKAVENMDPPKIEAEVTVDKKKTKKAIEDAVKDGVKVDVEPEVKKGEEKVKAFIKGVNKDAKITPEVDMSEAERNFKIAKDNLKEYMDLQNEIVKGNRRILRNSDGSVSSGYVYGGDLRKGKATQASVKRELDSYLAIKDSDTASDATKQAMLDTLAAYVNALGDTQKAEKIFGKAHADIFEQVQDKIKNAQASLEAYEKADAAIRAARYNLNQAGLLPDTIKFGQWDKMVEALMSGGVENAIEYLKKEFGTEVPQAAQKTEQAVEEAVTAGGEASSSSVSGVNNEAEAVDKLKERYLELLEAKQKLNDVSFRYSTEEAYYPGTDTPDMKVLEKNGFVNLIRQYYDKDQADEILTNLEKDVKRFNKTEERYVEEQKQQNFLDNFKAKSFDEQLAFFDKIAKKSKRVAKQTKEDFEMIKSFRYAERGDIEFELEDGTKKKASSIMDIGDTFKLYEEIRDKIKSINIVDTWVEGTREQLDSQMMDFNENIARAMEPIVETIHNKLQEAFTLDDHMLSVYNQVLEEWDRSEPFEDSEDRYVDNVIARREKIQQGLQDAFKDKIKSGTDAPQELIATYKELWETIDSSDTFPNLLEAIDKVNAKASELGVVFDNVSGKWVTAEQQIERAQNAIDKIQKFKKDVDEARADVEITKPKIDTDEPYTKKDWNADYNQGKKELKDYYDRVIMLQKKMDSFSTDTPEEEVEALKKELYEAQVAFAAAFDVLNDYSDYKLGGDQKGSASKAIKELYSSLINGNDLASQRQSLLSSEAAFTQYGEELEEVAKKSQYTKEQLEELFESGRTQSEAASALDVLSEALDEEEKARKEEQSSTEAGNKAKDESSKKSKENAEEAEREAESHKKNADAIREENEEREHGYLRKESGYDESPHEYTEKINDFINKKSTPVYDKNGNLSYNEKYFLDFDKALKSITTLDEKIIKQIHEIKGATEEEVAPMLTNLHLLEAQRKEAEDWVKTMVESPKSEANESQLAEMERVRDAKREQLETELRIKDVKAEHIKAEKEQAAAEKAREDALREEKNTREAIAKTQDRDLETKKAPLIKEQEDAYKRLWDIRVQIAKLDNDINNDHSNEIAKLKEMEQAQKKIVIDKQNELRTIDKSVLIYDRLNAMSSIKRNALDAIGRSSASSLDTIESKESAKAEADKNALLKKQEAAYKELWQTRKKIAVLDNDSTKDHGNQIAELKKQEQIAKNTFDSLQSQLHAMDDSITYISRYNDLAEIKRKAQQEVAEAIGKEVDALAEAAAKEEERVNAKNIKAASDADAQAAKQSNVLYDKIVSNLNEIYDLKKKNVKLDNESVEDQVELADNTKKINSLYSEVSDTIKEINAAGAQQVSREEEILKLRRQLNDELTVATQKQAGSEVDNLVAGVDKYLGKIKQINDGKYTQSFKDTFALSEQALNKISDELIKIKANGIDALDSARVKELVRTFNELADSIDGSLGEKGLSKNKQAAQSSLEKLKKSIEDIEARNTAMGASFRSQFENLKLKIDTAESNEEVERLKAAIVKLEGELIAAGKTGKSVFQQFGEAVRTSSRQFLAQYFSLQDFVRYAREGFNTVVQVDSALTELRKVSDASDDRLAQSFKKSTETAKELGTTISDVIGVTADWARLGFNVDEAEELARVTALFQTVGDNMSAEETSSYLISTLQGFQMATDQAEEIADKYNEVANNFAIDTKGIGEAMQRSAASFNAANTDLSESIALVTATNTVVQDPSSVGTLWKTLSARIRGAKTELEDLGEEEDEFTQTTSKLQGLVKSLTGFDILEKDGKTFKSIYDIIIGIGKEWKNLSDIEQASLGEALAGKRNANALYAVLNNIETLEKAYATAKDSAGSAQKEQENYAKSIEYSLGQMKAAAQEFWTTFIESGAAKKAVDTVTHLLELLTKITEETNGFATITGAGLLGILGHNPELVVNLVSELVTSMGLLPSSTAEAAGEMTKLGTSMTVFQNAATKIIASPLTPWILVGVAAIAAFTLAWDGLTTTVAEAQADLDKTSGKIDTLKTEIEELKDIDYRTEDQENRLEYLEQELDYQEKIFEIEKKRILQEKVGSKFSDYFDRDNYNLKYKNETNTRRGDTAAGLLASIAARNETLEGYKQLQQEYVDYLDKNRLQMSVDEVEEYTREIASLGNEISKLNDSNVVSVDTLKDKVVEFQAIIDDAQEGIDSGLLIGSDKADAEKVIQQYKGLIEQINDAINPILKENGLYDFSSVIESTFEKVEFEGLKDKLVEIAKSGELSPDLLTEEYGSLISNLEIAEVDADTLYKYLMRLSGIVDRANLSNKINDQLRHGYGVGTLSGSEYDKHRISNYINSLSEEDAQIVAGLDIDWTTFNADEAIKKMQSEINKAKGNPVEVNVEFDVGKFELKDADLESMQSLYESFRNNVENNEIKVPLDISDVESLPDTWKNLEGFKDFELKVTTSTAVDEVQKAFDDMATEWANKMIDMQGATKETMDMVKAQLKMDGLEESGVDKLVDSLVAEDKMNSLIQTLDQAQHSEEGVTQSTIEAAAAFYDEAQQLGITDDVLKDYLVQAAAAGHITLSGDTSWLDLLAEKLQIDIGLLKELMGLVKQGDSYAVDTKTGSIHSIPKEAEEGIKKQKELRKELENTQKYRGQTLKSTSAEKSAAGGAGKDAGDAYVEAYEKELEQLQKDRDRGLISERQYLDRLKALIDRFFKDRAQYAEKYMDEMKSYMDALLSHYNSVISGVTTLIGRRITALQKEKDAAISALQEEQEAAEAAYQARIDEIQEEIDAYQEKIDALEKEIKEYDKQIEKIDEEIEKLDEEIEVIDDVIEELERRNKTLEKEKDRISEIIEGLDEESEALDEVIKKKQKEQEVYNDQIQAIQDENAARERSINLQKAEYEMQRAMNQRNKLVCKYARGYSNVA